ncbi:MAG: polymorphic toxin-type HINT domain-containing protein [Pirellulaceae bacterium]|nr:polymorphic toxin-type HINT domain-containing protein [Pirellulaceae bacterium]
MSPIHCLPLRAITSRLRRIVLISMACSIVFAFVAPPLSAASKSFRAKEADRLFREALREEMQGDNHARDELLAKALKQVPNYGPAMWRLGKVKVGDRWTDAEAAGGQLSAKDQAEYATVRKAAGDALGQLNAANWCRSHGLWEQERAHLTRALDFAPNNTNILSRLGFRFVQGRWASAQQLQSAAQSMAQRTRSLKTWLPPLQKIERGLNQRSRRKREAHEKQLLAIDDPAAIPALEMMAESSDQRAKLVVAALGGIDDHRASLALARLAVRSNDMEVRRAAAQQLQTRDHDHFVPALLAGLETPLTTRTVAYRHGDIVRFLHSYQRENQFDREQLIVNSGDADSTSEVAVSARNTLTNLRNDRIVSALNIATNQQLPAEAQQWWKWWNDTNEVFVEGEKQTIVSGAVTDIEQLVSIDQQREASRLRLQQANRSTSSSSRRRHDCLAPGTLIWTSRGAQPVEQLATGDLVLSQDIESGELSYKPVLRATTRPESTLIRITMDHVTIEASGGHPFWVAGVGWTKARDLKPGMNLYGADSMQTITDVGEGQTTASHNLIVADFSSYFVGEQRILSHDNTVRRPTNNILPGLSKE